MSKVLFSSLLLLILILPFDEGGNGYIVPLITQVVLLLCATCWAIQTIRRKQCTLIFDRIDVFVLGFIAWAVLSSYFSVYKYATFLELIKIFSYASLFYLCRILFPLKKSYITGFIVAIFASSFIQFLVSLYSLFVLHTPILQAGFVNPNKLACFFVIGIAIALSFLLFFRQEKKLATSQHLNFLTSHFLYFGAFVALVCLMSALFALKSRGAVVSFLGIGVFLATLKKKWFGFLCLVVVCLLITLPFAGRNSVIKDLGKLDDPFAYQRIGIWKSSLAMISDYPTFGVGLGLYAGYGATYNFPVEHVAAYYGKQINAAHSDILQIGAEIGVIGLIFFLAIIFFIGYYSLLQFKKLPVSWQVAASSAALLGLFVQGLFSTLLSSPAIAMTAVVLGVILLDGAKKYRQKPYKIFPSWRWYVVLFLLFFYILIPVIIYPFLGHVYYLKYQKLRRERDIPRAVEHLRTALKYIPIHAYYHSTLGNLYLAAFRNQPNLDAFYEGYKELTQAIWYNPREYTFYLGLAELHREMFRQKLPTKPTAQNAIQEYQRAIQYNPFNPFIRHSLATLYADIEEFELAIATLQEALKIEPNFVGGHQTLGRLLSHLGRELEAKNAFEQAESILQRYTVRESDPDYFKSLLRSFE